MSEPLAKRVKITGEAGEPLRLGLHNLADSSTYSSNTPFPHLAISIPESKHNFLQDLRRELVEPEYFNRSDDASEMFATDLSACTLPNVRNLHDAFSTEVAAFASRLIGADTGTLKDLTAMVFRRNGYRVCHNEAEHTGCLSVLLFLQSEDWDPQEGGDVELFGLSAGLPHAVSRRVHPTFGSVLALPCGPDVYWRVAEVVGDRPLLCVCATIEPSCKPNLSAPSLSETMVDHCTSIPVAHSEEGADLGKFISENFLVAEAFENMRQDLVDESNLELCDFLHPKIYEQLEIEVGRLNVWSVVGPAHIQHIHSLRTTCQDGHVSLQSEAPPSPTLSAWLLFLQSSRFKQYLSEISGLSLDTATLSIECYCKGDYSLARPRAYHDSPSLEVVFTVVSRADPNGGGYVSYVDGEAELLTIFPEPNALALVVRCSGTSHFVKFVNNDATCDKVFFTLSFKLSDEDLDSQESTPSEGVEE